MDIYDSHMMCTQFNEGAIYKGSGAKELVRTVKTFEYKNIKSGLKCYDNSEKTIYHTNHVDTPGPQEYFQTELRLILTIVQMDQ